mmetsp:Transcript_613/g.1330  ORF Transcript_613/g.1330 Transcript_613/m.1330 type:complete len:493 (+) Transcript_613:248-1726(+)
MNTATIPTVRRCAIASLAMVALLASYCSGSFLDIGGIRDGLSLDMDEVLRNFGRIRRLQRQEARRLEFDRSEEWSLKDTTVSAAFKNHNEQDRLDHDHDHDHFHQVEGPAETDNSVEEFVVSQQLEGARNNVIPSKEQSDEIYDEDIFIFNGANGEATSDGIDQVEGARQNLIPPREQDEEPSIVNDTNDEAASDGVDQVERPPADEVTSDVETSDGTDQVEQPPIDDVPSDAVDPVEIPPVNEVTSDGIDPVERPPVNVTSDGIEPVEAPTVGRPATPPVFPDSEQIVESEGESATEVNNVDKPPPGPVNDSGFFAVENEDAGTSLIAGDETLDVTTTPDAESVEESGPRGGSADHSPGVLPTEISFMILMDEFRYSRGVESVDDIGIGTKFAFTGRIATKAEELGIASGSCTVTSDFAKELSYCDIYHKIDTDNYGGFGSVIVAGTVDAVGGRLLVTGTGGSLQRTHEGYATVQFDPAGNPVLYVLLQLF